MKVSDREEIVRAITQIIYSTLDQRYAATLIYDRVITKLDLTGGESGGQGTAVGARQHD